MPDRWRFFRFEKAKPATEVFLDDVNPTKMRGLGWAEILSLPSLWVGHYIDEDGVEEYAVLVDAR